MFVREDAFSICTTEEAGFAHNGYFTLREGFAFNFYCCQLYFAIGLRGNFSSCIAAL